MGAGVVGRSILKAHVDAGLSVHLVDQDERALADAIHGLHLSDEWRISPIIKVSDRLTAVAISRPASPASNDTKRSILVESIAEKLDIKQHFFAEAERLFPLDTILCSNTSTLRVSAIASRRSRPEQFAGMHFFMPVDQRPAVEVVRGDATNDASIAACREHVASLNKEPLVVKDSPGFIVNRLLSPYLNQAMLLLCHGIAAERIEQAALEYGMPMSPLELIDTIGTRTTFDAGRVYWQSFPQRIAPAPLLGKMIKLGRAGRAVGRGFYNYDNGKRSLHLADETQRLAESYFRPIGEASDQDLIDLLSIPMWIEAEAVMGEGTADSPDVFDVAMRGGLGFSPERSWREYFLRRGADSIKRATATWGSEFKSMLLEPVD